MTPARDRILAWYREGLAAVDPANVTREALAGINPGDGRLIVLAIGKAAVAMAGAARDVFGDRIDAGLLVAKQGQLTEEVEGFTAIEAAHPVPDEHSLRAGELALELVADLAPQDTVIALISGGGSSLLECPIEGVSLMDMRVTTELIMYAGAGIYELNTVRKALSAIKGGGLRRAIGEARCITFLLSDVIGNDPTIIASGPTVPGPTLRGPARQVLEDFHIQDQVPESVRVALGSEAPSPEQPDTVRDVRRVIADNATFVTALAAAAEKNGLRAQRAWENWHDDARDLAHRVVSDLQYVDPEIDVLIGGGEATSIVRGDGLGGRNCETALCTALSLPDDLEWTFASLASDGDDGNSGAAGAVVDCTTVDQRAFAESALAASDAAGYLEQRNALVVTGQTGTNVNDIYIAVRNSAVAGEIA